MKYQNLFSEKKIYLKCRLLKFLPRVLSLKGVIGRHVLSGDNLHEMSKSFSGKKWKKKKKKKKT